MMISQEYDTIPCFVMNDAICNISMDTVHENLDRALEYYEESLAIRENNDGENEDALGYVLANLGTFHEKQGNAKKAIKYLLRSLEVRSKINDKEGISASLSNLGMIYNKLGDLDKALKMNQI